MFTNWFTFLQHVGSQALCCLPTGMKTGKELSSPGMSAMALTSDSLAIRLQRWLFVISPSTCVFGSNAASYFLSFVSCPDRRRGPHFWRLQKPLFLQLVWDMGGLVCKQRSCKKTVWGKIKGSNPSFIFRARDKKDERLVFLEFCESQASWEPTWWRCPMRSRRGSLNHEMTDRRAHDSAPCFPNTLGTS